MIKRLNNLYNFLQKNKNLKEAFFLNHIITSTYKINKIGSSPSIEDILTSHNLTPIRFIAGTEASSRGEGQESTQGNVYEVDYQGTRAIAKIIPAHNNEDRVFELLDRLMDITEDEKKHLPRIFEKIKTDDYKIILMEALEPMSGHVQNVLKSKKYRDKNTLLKNENFIYKIIEESFERTDAIRSLANTEIEKEFFEIFKENKNAIKNKLSKALLTGVLKFDDIFTFLKELLVELSQESARDFDYNVLNNIDLYINNMADFILNKINSYLDVSMHPLPKHYSPNALFETVETLRGRAFSDPDMQGALDTAMREQELTPYENNPESFYYSENYLPESKSLFSLLKKIKAQTGIEWSDVYHKNIMQRPATRDLVLIDFGHYEIPEWMIQI